MIINTINDEIVKSKSVAFTGHRIIKENFNEQKLNEFLEKLIHHGFTNFYIGMAIGFDSIVFKNLEKLRKKHNIKLIACIPCLNQDERFNFFQKAQYKKMVKSADYKVVLYKEYNQNCMQERNMFMVDNSSLVISYMYKSTGGTFNTVKYANKKGVKVYNVNYLMEE